MENKQLKSFKDLLVWQKAAELAVLIYSITEKFPKSELYGIVNQMRRSAVSISSNIAEGFKRNHKKEKLQFYNVAYGSIAELESQIEISYRLKFFNDEDCKKLNQLTTEVGKMTDGLIKSLNKPPKSYILYPLFANASTIQEIINKTIAQVIQPFVSFLIVLATVVFIWGVIEFIAGAENEKKRIDGKKHIMWGLLGLFIMVAVAGLMWVLLNFWTSVK